MTRGLWRPVILFPNLTPNQKNRRIHSNKIKAILQSMSSKNSNKKSDDKIDKEEEALKAAEIVALSSIEGLFC